MTGITGLQIAGLPAIARGDGIWVFSPQTRKILRFAGDREQVAARLPAKYVQEPYPFGPLGDLNKAHICLILTNACNLRCPYCSVSLKSAPRTMSPGLIEAAVDFIFHRFPQPEIIVSFFGGEPTLALERLEQACGLLAARAAPEGRRLKFTLTTNGVFGARQLELLTRHGFSVLFSLDGPREIQDFQRPRRDGASSYTTASANLQALIARGLQVSVTVTLTAHSTPHWREILEALGAAGVRSVQLDPVFPFPWSQAVNQGDPLFARPPAAQYIEAVLGAFHYARKHGITCSNPVFGRLSKPSRYYCDLYAGAQAAAINVNGDLVRCAEVQDARHPLYPQVKIGYFHEAKKTFITLGPAGSPDQDRRSEPPACQECIARFHCAGGCYIRNRLLNNSPEARDEFMCRIFQELMVHYLDFMATESSRLARLEKD